MSDLSWAILIVGAIICGDSTWTLVRIFRHSGARRLHGWAALLCLTGMVAIFGYLFGETLN